MSSIYRRCPVCRAYLEKDEVCGCMKRAAASAANTDNGKVENGLDIHFSTSIIAENTEDASMKKINAEKARDQLRTMADVLTDNQVIYAVTFLSKRFGIEIMPSTIIRWENGEEVRYEED